MGNVTDEQLIEILRDEAVPALGCTEPVACALACAKCREVLGKIPEKVDVLVSGNIYKNGMGVGIPGTGMRGLSIAAALGAICGKTEYGLQVLKEVSVGDNLERAKALCSKVNISMKPDCQDKLYAEAICSCGDDVVTTIIIKAHTNIVKVVHNGNVVFANSATVNSDGKKRPELSVKRIWDFINTVDIEKIKFLNDAVVMNNAIADEGLKNSFGLKIGKTLNENISKGILAKDLLSMALIRATAASDARMDGCEKPVMTNSGSGNQGITVTMPVVVAADFFKSGDDKMLRALSLSNLVAAHIHYYLGHLSALCGITIAATGAASAITYLMGGSYEQVVNSIKTMASGVTGMICDGAKQGCALKVYAGVSSAVQSALLSMNDSHTKSDGIVEECVEKTIQNIGLVGSHGMEETDRTILDVMCKK